MTKYFSTIALPPIYPANLANFSSAILFTDKILSKMGEGKNLGYIRSLSIFLDLSNEFI